jgi:DNA-binding NarL/FixJ family response regulator
MTRVVIADDEALVRDGLAVIVAADPGIEVVAAVASGREALEAVARHDPEVVLMDVRMPDMDGIEATSVIARDHPHARVLMLTTVQSDEVVLAALQAGAAGFLLKSCAAERLREAIRRVAAGEPLLAPSVLQRVIDSHVARGAREASPNDFDLTPRQRDLVMLVARGRSNAEISAELHLAESTVKGYVSDILLRLGLRDRTQLAVLAHESGWVEGGR